MLTEEEIKRALHAARVVSVTTANPHGPLGLEQLAAAVAEVRGEPIPDRILRPIALRVETWEKLNYLAQAAARGSDKPSSPSALAAALLEQIVAGEK